MSRLSVVLMVADAIGRGELVEVRLGRLTAVSRAVEESQKFSFATARLPSCRMSTTAPGPLHQGTQPTSTDCPWRSGWGTDRKSTRLNSSHLGISYAVFCLK